jgi:two-component system sensor histidine kinase BaeS
MVMKIHRKLFVILFGFSLLLVTALVLLIQWSIGRGMVEYVNTKEVEAMKPLVADLGLHYQKQNNWSEMQGQQRAFEQLVFLNFKKNNYMPGPPPFHLGRPPPPPENNFFEGGDNKIRSENRAREKNFPPLHKANYALLDARENLIVGHYRKDIKYSKTAVIVDNKNVGFLAIPKRNEITNGYELDFIEQQRSYLWIIALVIMMLVALLAQILARHLVGPIKKITQATHKLTQGDYEQSLDSQSNDELGELSRDVNELTLTLDQNNKARKRWLANISHELRTPVTILRGELEAMLDDVRPLNKKNIASANDEVKHLHFLINDLQQLTSADIGGIHCQKVNEDLSLWLNSAAHKYRSYLADAGITLELMIEPKQANIFADSIRLCQLFDNLINNCVKYAQAKRVKISLEIDRRPIQAMVIVKVEDDGVGVEKQHLPYLFEYLYRVENSRNRKTGGSGLGLSICAHIVAAHQGKICAAQSDLGGLAIIIELPLSK